MDIWGDQKKRKTYVTRYPPDKRRGLQLHQHGLRALHRRPDIRCLRWGHAQPPARHLPTSVRHVLACFGKLIHSR